MHGILKIFPFLISCCLASASVRDACAELKVEPWSYGVYLIRYKNSTKIAAGLDIVDDKDFDATKLSVYVICPDRKKIIYLKSEKQEKKNKAYFYFDPVPLESIGRDDSAFGDYTFIISDPKGVIGTYIDSLSQSVMGSFAPGAIVPGDKATVSAKNLAFAWNKVRGANTYRLKIYQGKKFDSRNQILSRTTEDTKLKIFDINLPKGIYWWRLDAIREKNSEVDNIVRFTLGDEDRLPTFTVE